MSPRPALEIMIAEDNPADVALVREALREHRLDCNLRVLDDGAAAIAFLDRLDRHPLTERLDLVLLDMRLPKRDGVEILKKLRSTEHFALTPVIVMTASESPDVREQAEKHAALHYFQKPSSLAEFMQLGEIVQGILERRAAGGDPSPCGYDNGRTDR